MSESVAHPPRIEVFRDARGLVIECHRCERFMRQGEKFCCVWAALMFAKFFEGRIERAA